MKIHLVKKGDTLYEIAKKHGVTLEQLIAANPQIADPNQIDVGAKVRIPMVPKPVPTPQVEVKHKHTVSQGDTMWKISKAWEVPLKLLIDANPHLKNPSILMTGDTVYIPKLSNDGHLTAQAQSKAELTAPIVGKKNTAPKEELLQPIPNPAPPEAPVAPVQEEKPVEQPVAEKPVEQPAAQKPVEAPAAEKPVAPAAEKPVAPANEKPSAPINVQPNLPVNEKPNLPINVNPTLPIAEKPIAPIAQKPIAPIAQKPAMPVAPITDQPPFAVAQKPEKPNPLPIIQGIQEAKKPELPNLPLVTAPAAEASKEAHKSPCPPLPPFVSPLTGYPELPGVPPMGAYPYQPQAVNPFYAYPMPAMEVFSPQQGYVYPQEPDCGCGGGGLNLPYALAPEANKGPVAPLADANNAPYPGVHQAAAPFAGFPDYPCPPYAAGHDLYAHHPVPYASPYGVSGYPPVGGMPAVGGYPGAGAVPGIGGMPGADGMPGMGGMPGVGGMPGMGGLPGVGGMPGAGQPWMSQPTGWPGYPAMGADQLMPTYATPYADPYAFPGFEPHTAPHALGLTEDGAGPGRDEELSVHVNDEESTAGSKNARKTSSPRSSSSKPKAERSEKAALHAFLERQRPRDDWQDTKNSRPWINL